ncbi:MAG: aspartate aminotransferase family protein [Gammaproteobacteria bacterium]|nr:aspartate aminotransferase family protein [Gammaproteobacteria bacterium]
MNTTPVDALMTTYKRMDVTFVRGEGAWLWDSTGRRYLDALSGIAVCGLGHAHPQIAAALCEQAQLLWHTSNLYRIAHQEELGRRLALRSGLERVFFGNSGAEANEAAIKVARLYGRKRGLELPHVIVMEGSFHGRTMATLSATGNAKVQAGFEPLVQGFLRVTYGDLSAVEALFASRRDIVAVLVEPVQGEGGIVVPPAGYLRGLRELCTRHEALLMFDEIQSGMCRTGTWFAFQHEGIVPDVMTLAKSLGNGFPIGACLAAGAAAEVLQPGTHGSTFGGNPLATRVGVAVMDALEAAGQPARAAELGTRMLAGFRARFAGVDGVSVRGLGLMLGIELDRPCGDLVGQALAAGLLINVTADRVVRLLPPLVISDAEADEIMDTVSELVRRFVAA